MGKLRGLKVYSPGALGMNGMVKIWAEMGDSGRGVDLPEMFISV